MTGVVNMPRVFIVLMDSMRCTIHLARMRARSLMTHVSGVFACVCMRCACCTRFARMLVMFHRFVIVVMLVFL
jgi:hypothetical protein